MPCPNNSINYNTVKSLIYCFFVLSLPYNVYKDYKFCKCLYHDIQNLPISTHIKSIISHSDVHIVILSCGTEIVPLHVDSYWGSRICSYIILVKDTQLLYKYIPSAILPLARLCCGIFCTKAHHIWCLLT